MLTGVKRVTSMNRKISEGEKQIRRRIRAKRKGHGDTCKENEGEAYSAGVFWTMYFTILFYFNFLKLLTVISEECQFLNFWRM